jgi:hypothetical protein
MIARKEPTMSANGQVNRYPKTAESTMVTTMPPIRIAQGDRPGGSGSGRASMGHPYSRGCCSAGERRVDIVVDPILEVRPGPARPGF